MPTRRTKRTKGHVASYQEDHYSTSAAVFMTATEEAGVEGVNFKSAIGSIKFVWAHQGTSSSAEKYEAQLLERPSDEDGCVWIKWTGTGEEECIPETNVVEIPSKRARNRSGPIEKTAAAIHTMKSRKSPVKESTSTARSGVTLQRNSELAAAITPSPAKKKPRFDATAPDKKPRYWIGTSVSKVFYDADKGVDRPFSGEITAYDPEKRLYLITYEDGDEEEMNDEELGKFVVDALTPVVKKKVHYLSKNDSDLELGDSGEEVKPKKKAKKGKDKDLTHDSDSDEFKLDPDDDVNDDDESFAEDEPIAKNSTIKKKPVRKTNKNKGLSPSRRGGKSVGDIANLSTQSVAVRGLPEGALARGHGGFEIRALERVSMLQNGSGSPADALPCRILVVSSGTGVSSTGQPLCPAFLVDQIFENGEELHTLTNGNICTYEMIISGDEAWMSWDAMRRRLIAAGVLAEKSLHLRQGFEVVVTEVNCIDENDTPVAEMRQLKQDIIDMAANQTERKWALIEGRSRETAMVILSVPTWLVEHSTSSKLSTNSFADHILSHTVKNEGGEIGQNLSLELLPRLSKEACNIRLATSLLQKSIRRRSGVLCSPAPLIEACQMLLLPGTEARGKSSAFLRTLCGSMLADAMPAYTSSEALGIDSLLALWIVSLADADWIIPPILARRAVSAALRAQARDSNQWIGFMRQARLAEDQASLQNIENVEHETKLLNFANRICQGDMDDSCLKHYLKIGVNIEGRILGLRVKNSLRVLHAALGLNFTFGHWGKYTGDRENGAMYVTLHQPEYEDIWLQQERLIAPPVAEEDKLLNAWASPKIDLSLICSDKISLDNETRRAAFDIQLQSSSLLLLQALLSSPPIRSSKYGLPMLSRQWRKLSSEINPRDEERMLLERVQANTGSNKAIKKQDDQRASAMKQMAKLTSARDLFKGLSDKESELIEIIEEIQEWQHQRMPGMTTHPIKLERPIYNSDIKYNAVDDGPRVSSSSGLPLTDHDGRTAFVLAFGRAIPLKIKVDKITTNVTVLFCGTTASPLLVQRTDHTATEEANGACIAGASGAAAATPRLGYVSGSGPTDDMDEDTRLQAIADQRIYCEAVKETVIAWKGGMTVSLPIPPRGVQWNLEGATGCEKESSCKLTATLDEKKGIWTFTIAGKVVAPLDARNVICSCSRPSTIKSLASSTRLNSLLMRTFYAHSKSTDADNGNFDADGGKAGMEELGLSKRLELFEQLHSMAIHARRGGVDEGSVWGGWTELAASGMLHSSVWRDVLLKITTRDMEHAIVGPVAADGSGTGNDLSEGTVLRLFYALEALYPSVLIKEGALRWRVVPRGANYHHLLMSLEMLGRNEVRAEPKQIFRGKTVGSEICDRKLPSNPVKEEKQEERIPATTRRPRRSCATATLEAVAAVAAFESDARADREDEDFAAKRKVKKSLAANVDLSKEYLPVPIITSTLWEHQQRSVDSVLAGVREGKLGFADASAVGAGKTLTALATISGVANHLQESGISRGGSLIMLPQEALLREWLLEIAKHTSGFNIVEQRSDGTLFSLTYGKSGSPIDGNTLVISTLDRVAKAPFVRQASWDFVVIDECLAVQNAAAKRCPSAWRQIEVSRCGCLLLSATFFRSKYHNLFYMVRMLRSPLPRTIEYLPALVHEHIVCEVPITNRSWEMLDGSVSLADYSTYRRRINQWERDGLNRGDPSGFKLHADLKHLLRGDLWEGCKGAQTSPLADAIATQVQRLLKKGRRPVVFANTEDEKARFRTALRGRNLITVSWSEVSSKTRATGFDVILATIGSESSGINMQHDADSIVCRPTPGDVLEQMKGRVDRPGQRQNELMLVVVYAQATIEEGEFANIRLAGNFFRTYLAPKATRYKEALLLADLAAILSVHGGNKKGAQRPKAGVAYAAWHAALDDLTNANALQSSKTISVYDEGEELVEYPLYDKIEAESNSSSGGITVKKKKGVSGKGAKGKRKASDIDYHDDDYDDDDETRNVEPELKTLNKTKRNKRSNDQYAAAKKAAFEGKASVAIRQWLFKTNDIKTERLMPPEKDKLWEFSSATPPVRLTQESVKMGVRQLCNDPKLERIITRVGVDAIYMQVESFAAKPATKVRLFDYLFHGITFSMISIDAGNSFLRKVAIKAGTLIEVMPKAQRNSVLARIATEMAECGEYDSGMAPTACELLDGKGGGILLEAKLGRLIFPPSLIGVIVDACDKWGLPHLCAIDDDKYIKVGCGKNEGTEAYLTACRAHLKGTGGKVSVRYSLGALSKNGNRSGKGRFIIELVKRARRADGLPDVATMSDRDVAQRLLEIDGVGPWVAGECLVYHLGRADVMVSGDLTMRNMLNDLYNIDHKESETQVESAATFPDCTRSRILLDQLARTNGWHGYRTLLLFLSYFLQEDSLVLL